MKANDPVKRAEDDGSVEWKWTRPGRPRKERGQITLTRLHEMTGSTLAERNEAFEEMKKNTFDAETRELSGESENKLEVYDADHSEAHFHN